jgi:putative ABC transport system permease protein
VTLLPGHRGDGAVARLATAWRALTGSAPAAAVTLGLLGCLCAGLAVAGPRAGAELRSTALSKLIAAAPAANKTVVASTEDGTLSSPAGLSASQLLRGKQQLRRNLRGLPLSPAADDWSSLTTPLVSVTDNTPTLPATLPPKVELSYRDTLASNVRLVAGRLPVGQAGTATTTAGQAGSGATTVLQAAVTVATARRFGLDVGSRLALPGTSLLLDVTAIVQPRNSSALFWTADPAAAAPQLVTVGQNDYWIGGVFIGPGALGALLNNVDLATTQVTWTFPLDLDSLSAAQASLLQQQLAVTLATAGRFNVATVPVTVGRLPAGLKHLRFRQTSPAAHSLLIPLDAALSSGTPALLTGFESEAAAAGNVLDLLAVSLAVLAAVVVLLGGWLLAEQRRQDFAVLRARGAARRQLAALVLAVSAVTTVPGVVVGAALAVALTPSGPDALSWWLAGLVVVAALAGPVAVTVRTHRGYAAVVRPDAPPARLSAVRRLVVEAMLVAAAAGGLVVLRDQGNARGDVYASAAPVLLAVGVAVLVLRLYPLLVRGVLLLAGQRAGPAAFLGLVRAARVPAGAVLPAFAMVLALALVSFAGMVRGAVLRGEAAASWQQAGADAVITGTSPVTTALQRSVAAVPGVRHVAAAGVVTGGLASAGTGQFEVLLVDPAQYGRLIAGSPLPPVPAQFTASRAGRGSAAPVPVLASPGLAAQLGHGPVTVLLNATQLVTVRVVGQAADMSAVFASNGGYLVLTRQAAAALGVAPSSLLVTGQSLNEPALRAAVARRDAGATIVFRSRLLTRLAAAPLRQGAYLALALGAAAAACCCLLALLLSLLLSASARQLALARMTTMGLSGSQARLLSVVELLPQLLAVLAGGLVCGLALVPATGPALSLTVITGSASSVPVQIEPLWLVAVGAGLLVLAIVTLTGQTMLTDRTAPRSLRMGE